MGIYKFSKENGKKVERYQSHLAIYVKNDSNLVLYAKEEKGKGTK
ncbi:hypothetical protein ABEX78_11985 [Priestia megaterium]